MTTNLLTTDEATLESSLGGWAKTDLPPWLNTVVRSNAFAHGGSWSLQLIHDNSQNGAQASTSLYAVTPSTKYAFSAWVLADWSGGQGPFSIGIGRIWYDGGGSVIGGGADVATTVTSVSGTWYFVTGVATSPSNAASVRFYVGGSGTGLAGGALYFDDMSVERVASLVPPLQVGHHGTHLPPGIAGPPLRAGPAAGGQFSPQVQRGHRY